MPQTFYALQCAECATFQVVLRSAQTKFSCKLCGLKQSITRVYGSGAAKDARAIVQQLNMARAVGDTAPADYDDHDQFGWGGAQSYANEHAQSYANDYHQAPPQQQQAQPQQSRWAQYLPPQAPRAAVDEGDEGDDDPRFVTVVDRGGKRKRAAEQENHGSNRGGRSGGRGRGRDGGAFAGSSPFANDRPSAPEHHPSLSATAAWGGGGGDSYAARTAPPPPPAPPAPQRGRVACAANDDDDGFFCGASLDVAYEEEVWD
tara:strand:+ start:1599 stop:2378 length:780 start_codon:yes stop_codon:yes gene_type:complete